MIERNHLAIIDAIHRLGTMTEAANELCLTQSALSHAIKKLEQSLGTPLWEKQGRNIRLTQGGLAMLNLAQRLLPQFAHTEEKIHQIAKGKHGILKIGMECHPCYQWLLKVINPFLAKYPDVDVDVRQQFKFGGLRALRDFEIDMLITPDPLFLKPLKYVPAFHYEQVLVVSDTHPLRNEPYVTPDQLSKETLITYPVEPTRLDIYAQFLTPAGASVRQHKTIETTEILLQMIENNRGVGALPHWLVEQYQTLMNIHPVKLGEHGIAKTIHLGFRKDEVLPEYIEQFIALAKRSGPLG